MEALLALEGIGRLSRIAVIGGGVFGVTSALELSKSGHDVTIFEKNYQILQEGTAKSQNRLHIGLHYPRDLETAIQSRIGLEKFSSTYPELVRNNFPNYYAIASQGSKVSRKEFEDFAQRAEITLVSESDARPFGINHDMIDGIWRCAEGVIDIDKFRSILESELSASSVHVVMHSEICEIKRISKCWTLQDKNKLKYDDFDFVIRATYGSDQIKSEDINLRTTEFEYHRTLILEVASTHPPVGLTIVDGDFLTVLPKGFSDKYLLYAPSISVLDRSRGYQPKSIWHDSEQEIAAAQESLLNRTKFWLPAFQISEITGRQITTRSIQPDVSSTDKRVSEIKWLSYDIAEVWSGKIDHCIEISKEIAKQINLKSNIG